jgi:hypothetical protein
MAKKEPDTKEELDDIAIDGELTEEELEGIVGGCGHGHGHRRREQLPINRTVD